MEQTRLINRFVDFFLIEQRLKWKVYLTSVGVAAAWATLRFSFSDKREEEIGVEAAILLCVLVVTSVVLYVTRGKIFPVEGQELRVYPRLTFLSGLAGGVGVLLIA